MEVLIKAIKETAELINSISGVISNTTQVLLEKQDQIKELLQAIYQDIIALEQSKGVSQENGIQSIIGLFNTINETLQSKEPESKPEPQPKPQSRSKRKGTKHVQLDPVEKLIIPKDTTSSSHTSSDSTSNVQDQEQ